MLSDRGRSDLWETVIHSRGEYVRLVNELQASRLREQLYCQALGRATARLRAAHLLSDDEIVEADRIMSLCHLAQGRRVGTNHPHRGEKGESDAHQKEAQEGDPHPDR